MVAAIVVTETFLVCRLAANVINAKRKEKKGGCVGSSGCGDVLLRRLGVVVRRWRGGDHGFDDEIWS
jgi:hypothetical protein